METIIYRLLVIISLWWSACLTLAGQSLSIAGTVFSAEKKEVIENANVLLYKQDSIYLNGLVTDASGSFSFDNLREDNYTLVVSYIGYEARTIQVQHLAEPLAVEVQLNEESAVLDDVFVTASPVVTRINQRIVFPTRQQVGHSSNGIQLLNIMMLPGLRVNPMLSTVTASDGGEVILQINGVNATVGDIQALQPRQIKRVEYSDYSGIRYSHSAKVVNYIIERDERGGVVGVDLMNSLVNISGGDLAYAKYSKGKSAYSVNYVVAYQDFNSNERDRRGEFMFGGRPALERDELTEKGEYVSRAHDISLGYNYQAGEATFFNARLRYNTTDQPHNDFNSRLYEDGVFKGKIFEGLEQHTRNPVLDIYYQQALPGKQTIYVNLVGGYINTRLNRVYREYEEAGTADYDRQMRLRSAKYSLIGEGIYEKAFADNVLKVGMKHHQAYTSQEYLQQVAFESDLTQAESSLFAEWLSVKDRFSYSLGLRLNRSYYSNKQMSKDYYNLLPKGMVGYRFSDEAFIRYDVEMSQTSPTLVELTEAEIQIDPYQTERGNSRLKPFRNLNNTLTFEKRKGLFNFNLNLLHHYRHKPIMEAKREIDNRFVSMPENMKKWSKYNAEAMLRVGMIGNFLQFSLAGGVNHYDSHGNAYRHKRTSFYWRADVMALYKRMMFIAQAQPYSERLRGETLFKEGNYHYAAIQYNADRFSVGLGAFNPIKNVSRTIMENMNAQAPFRRVSYSDSSRILVVTFTWNMHFGKPLETTSKSLNNQDSDAGVREMYR